MFILVGPHFSPASPKQGHLHVAHLVLGPQPADPRPSVFPVQPRQPDSGGLTCPRESAPAVLSPAAWRADWHPK